MLQNSSNYFCFNVSWQQIGSLRNSKILNNFANLDLTNFCCFYYFWLIARISLIVSTSHRRNLIFYSMLRCIERWWSSYKLHIQAKLSLYSRDIILFTQLFNKRILIFSALNKLTFFSPNSLVFHPSSRLNLKIFIELIRKHR